MSLGALLGDRAAREFLARRWPDETMIVHRALAELPEPLREAPLRSFDELVLAYKGRVQIAGGHGDDHLQFTVSTDDPSYLRRIGLTVFFGDDVSAHAPGGAELLRGLERDLGAPNGIGAIRTFCSPAGGGLGVHYDQGDTFIVQLTGTKKIWLKRNTSYPTMQYVPGRPATDEHFPDYARSGFINEAPRGGQTVTMKPGSVLFVPRGMWHRTLAGTASFSASICVDTPSAIDLLMPQLKAALQQDARFRRPVFGGWSEGRTRAQAESQLAQLLGGVARAVSSLDPALLFDAAGARDVETVAFRPKTRFQKVPATRWKISPVRGEQVLTLRAWAGERETRLGIAAPLLPAVRWLMRREPAFTWSELKRAAGKAPVEHVESLLRALLGCEAVKWLPFQKLPGV
jgi:hypothetical protein